MLAEPVLDEILINNYESLLLVLPLALFVVSVLKKVIGVVEVAAMIWYGGFLVINGHELVRRRGHYQRLNAMRFRDVPDA